MNMQKMLKEMQKVQSKMANAQADLDDKTYKAEAGGGMVKLEINGQGKLSAIHINPDAVDPDDVEALEDLILAAFNNAVTAKDEATQASMGSLTKGMNIPGM